MKPVDSRYKNPDNDPRGPWLSTDVTAPFERIKLIYDWNGHKPKPGRCWRFTKEKAQELESEQRIHFSNNGLPRLKRYLAESESKEETEDGINPSRLELILRQAMGTVAEYIARYPNCLGIIEWRDLERALREVFEELGLDTTLTRSGKDGGFDLRVADEISNQTFLIELKHWLPSGQKPGKKIVTALVDVVVKSDEKATGLLLSSSGFTKEAIYGRTEIERHTVKLGGKQKIVSLCQDYLQSKQGVWFPRTELAQMILADTY